MLYSGSSMGTKKAGRVMWKFRFWGGNFNTSGQGVFTGGVLFERVSHVHNI